MAGHRPHRRLVASPLLNVSRTAFMLRSAAFAVLVAASAAIFFLLPAPPTVAVIMAITEFVSYDVAVPELSQLRLAGYALTYESPSETSLLMKNTSSPTTKKPLCLTGLMTPNVGARVSYRRLDAGPMVVVVERADDKPAAIFALTGGEAPAALQKASWIRLEAPTDDEEKNACAGKPSLRLPVYGPSRIGTPLRPESVGGESASGALIEGTIDLYAKTVDVTRLREGANRLYPTSVSFMSIPPGSEVSQHVEPGEARVPWAGFVRPNSDAALDARITTPANRIQIQRPGIGIEPETLATGLFARLTEDPVILSLQVAAVFLFSIFQVASSWFVARQPQSPTQVVVAAPATVVEPRSEDAAPSETVTQPAARIASNAEPSGAKNAPDEIKTGG